MRNGGNIDNVENLCTIMLTTNHFLRTQKHKVLQDFFAGSYKGYRLLKVINPRQFLAFFPHILDI